MLGRVLRPVGPVKVKDPVCGMTVDSEKAPAKGTYQGQTVYFCNEGCRKTYEARLKKP